jgi:hypothetical protein
VKIKDEMTGDINHTFIRGRVLHFGPVDNLDVESSPFEQILRS